jgi:hypothetical protein
MKEQTLSKKIKDGYHQRYIHIEDVKDFIKKLK